MKEASKWLDGQDDVEDLALFLDFDGTLAPIVERPDDARALEGVTESVESLGRVLPVAIISGRGLDDVAQRLGADGIYYAGSHGMEIRTPDGERHEPDEVQELMPALERQERRLRDEFMDSEGIELESKRFGVAVHFRRRPDARQKVEEALRRAVDEEEGLKVGTGKMVRELQPDIDWNKGTALEFIRRHVDPQRRRRPMYIGDDVTDEDAFAAIEDDGIGILVDRRPRKSAARFRLDDPKAVRQFLSDLVARL